MRRELDPATNTERHTQTYRHRHITRAVKRIWRTVATSTLSRLNKNGRKILCSLVKTEDSISALPSPPVVTVKSASNSSAESNTLGRRKLSNAHSSCKLFCGTRHHARLSQSETSWCQQLIPQCMRRRVQATAQSRETKKKNTNLQRCAGKQQAVFRRKCAQRLCQNRILVFEAMCLDNTRASDRHTFHKLLLDQRQNDKVEVSPTRARK